MSASVKDIGIPEVRRFIHHLQSEVVRWEDKPDIRELLDIPLHWQIISIIPFGYYDETESINALKRSRRPLAKVAFLNSVENPIESNRAFTGDSTLEELLDDQKARAVLEKHLPGILSHTDLEIGKAYASLNEIASSSETQLDPEIIKAIVADLNQP